MLEEIRKAMIKLGAGLALAILACTLTPAQDVTTNSMPGTDFTEYHTYKWVPIDGAVVPDQIIDAQIKQSIDSQLATKGLTKTDGENADLLIGYQISISQEKQWNAYGTGGMRWGGGMASTQQSTISTGTLVLDMYDPAGKQLVWTGRIQDPRSRRHRGQKAEESRQGHAETVEDFSTEGQVVPSES
jgi:hypothetical protein